VPRAWTHLIAEAAASRSTRVLPPPLSWREYPARRTGLAPPRR
jgi:hypothetical protein